MATKKHLAKAIGGVVLDDNGDVFCNQRCHDAHHAYMDCIRAERASKGGE